MNSIRSNKKMKNSEIMILSILFVLMIGLFSNTCANIPEPDTILYGELYINGQLITASDDVTISVRRDEVEIASYKMGSNSQTGNQFLLRIPMQSADDGFVSSLKAQFGDSIQIFVKQGFGAATKVLNADFEISGRGIIEFHRLFVGDGCIDVDGDFNQDCNVNLADLILFGSHWLDAPCSSPGWCGGRDLSMDGKVNLFDLKIIAENWMKCLSVDCY